jgi:3-oxoadipate enol-lactonase
VVIPHARADGPAGAPAIVFSSSLGTNLELWSAQAEALAPSFRVVRYDHRGHGGTPAGDGAFDIADLAGDVLELAGSLGLERFSFVGISLGGAVGQWLGANAPERLERLVLACTSPRFANAESYGVRAAQVRAGGLEPLAEASLGRWLGPDPDPEQRKRLRSILLSTPREGYAACCEAIAGWDFRSELGRIAAPTLTIAGANDPSTPPAELETIAAAVPGARSVVLDGYHLVNVDRADAFTAAVREHLAS